MTGKLRKSQPRRQVKSKVNRKNYDYLLKTRKRTNLLFGSAGSGKSWAIAQFWVIEKMCKEHGVRILVTRKTGPALTKSCWTLVQDLLKNMEIPYAINKSDRVITIGSNEMWFVALDDPEKLKSIESINYVWAEEATELTQNDYMQLHLRCRGHNINGDNMLVFSFNPIQKPGVKYLKSLTESPPERVGVLHSTYRDNAFLDDNYINDLETLGEMDETYHQIYTLGKWAIAKNIIYTNWDVWSGKWPNLNDFEIFGYGLDFGFNAPSALVEVGIIGNETWERELIYEPHLTNTDLMERCEAFMINKEFPLVADSAEPDRIEEFKRSGFYAIPCIKGKGTIQLGIDRVKRFNCHFHKESVNMINEAETYKWKETPDGEPMDVPLDFNNHTMDARRYFISLIDVDADTTLEVVGNYLEGF